MLEEGLKEIHIYVYEEETKEFFAQDKINNSSTLYSSFDIVG